MYNGTIGLNYDCKNRFLNIQCSSVPALLYGTSFKTVGIEDLTKISDAIQQQVNDYVKLDCNQMVITRLDNSLLYDMNDSPANYIGLLDSITRDNQFRYNKTYYQLKTIQLRNKQKCIGFYDKFEKNRLNKLEMLYIQSTSDVTQNKLRYEIQNKSAKALKTVTNTDYTILSQVNSDQFITALHRQRITEFEKHFKYDSSSFQTLKNIHSTMKEKKKRYAINDTVWYLMLKSNMVTLEDIRKLMQTENYSRQAIHKRLKELAILQSTDIEKANLLGELHQKIIHHAA
jgi:hypothetical protein